MPIEELSPFGQCLVLLNQFLALFIRGRRKKVGMFEAVWGLVGIALLPLVAVYVFVVVYGSRVDAASRPTVARRAGISARARSAGDRVVWYHRTPGRPQRSPQRAGRIPGGRCGACCTDDRAGR
jgi:hypothetical protein